MKLCSRHSTDLISMLKRKGLYKFCDSRPAIVEERRQKWLDGMTAPSEIDPMIVATLEIESQAVAQCGNLLYFKHLNGQEKCPLCEVAKIIKHRADAEWIDNVTDAIHSLCLQNGIMNPSTVAH